MRIDVSDVNLTDVISKAKDNPWVGKLVLSANAERVEDTEYFLSILKGTFFGYTVHLTDADPTSKDSKVSKEDPVAPSKELQAQLKTISATTKVDDIAAATLTLINQFVCKKLTERFSEVDADAEESSVAGADADAEDSSVASADADATNKAAIKPSRFTCNNIGPCILGFALVILGMALPRYLEGK